MDRVTIGREQAVHFFFKGLATALIQTCRLAGQFGIQICRPVRIRCKPCGRLPGSGLVLLLHWICLC